MGRWWYGGEGCIGGIPQSITQINPYIYIYIFVYIKLVVRGEDIGEMADTIALD